MNTSQKAQTLEMLPSMKKINAIECSIQFNKTYQVRIDWHEFSSYLDELKNKGILKVTNPGGMTQYALNN